MNTPKLILTCTLLALLQGCAAAVVAGGATAVTSANDRRTLGAQIDDKNAVLKAQRALADDALTAEGSNINVTSYNGVVLLTGQTASEQVKDQAQRLVSGSGAAPLPQSAHQLQRGAGAREGGGARQHEDRQPTRRPAPLHLPGSGALSGQIRRLRQGLGRSAHRPRQERLPRSGTGARHRLLPQDVPAQGRLPRWQAGAAAGHPLRPLHLR